MNWMYFAAGTAFGFALGYALAWYVAKRKP